MSETTINYMTYFLVALCAAVALLVVIPAASAASNRMRPGWRAWVWPMVFLSLALSSLCGSIAIIRRDPDNALLPQLTILLTGLTLHWIILNSFYRSLGDVTARVIAPFTWLFYAIFVVSQILTSAFLSLTVYELVCGVVLAVVYSSILIKERALATDAPPILTGLVLTVLGVIINNFSFRVELGIAVVSNEAIFHLFQAVGVIFFMLGGNASYGVKYNAQRRRERELLN